LFVFKVSEEPTDFHHVLIKPNSIPGRELLQTPSKQIKIAQEEPLVPGVFEEGRETRSACTGFIATVSSDFTHSWKVSDSMALV
jgi:hypothetical protein